MELAGFYFGADQLTALVQVILIDLVMSGDNAIIIGMAVAGLPKANRTRIISASGTLTASATPASA